MVAKYRSFLRIYHIFGGLSFVLIVSKRLCIAKRIPERVQHLVDGCEVLFMKIAGLGDA